MSVLKESGVTEMDGKNVATIIREIGSAIGELTINEVNTDSIISISTALRVLGSLDAALIDNINNLSKLDISIAENIINFISRLDFSNIAILQDEHMGESLKNLTTLMNSIVSILNTSSIHAFSLLAPARGYLIGKSIGQFYKQMVDAIP